MSRRSQRLVKGGYYQGEDDAASNSSTGSASGNPVSYRESPVRIFKKKITTKRQTPQYSSYSNASNESLASYASDALEEPIRNWVSNVSMRNGSPGGSRGSSRDKLLSSLGSTSPASDLLLPSSLPYNSNAYSGREPATRKALSETSNNHSSTYESHAPPTDPFGNSSGYSSEEDYVGRQQSDAGAARGFALSDVLLSPGKVAGMLFWWLGTAWYCLTSGASLLDVFVLTRQSHFLKKAVVFLLALLLVGA
ncbi:SUN domain-containing protein 2-like, partial [Polyodon spathula]|uniref:SUN domain-containing protein 2-like n=1 Tax=Polyodon spathula TaxID=7913 RepID=UPI001B7DF8F6